jgi:hypothetical protein
MGFVIQAGLWPGGGKASYRVVLGLADNAARTRLGTKSAAKDLQDAA